MPKVIYEKDDRIGRITLNRPEVMNAIDDDVPVELALCVARANADPAVHVIVLAGAHRHQESRQARLRRSGRSQNRRASGVLGLRSHAPVGHRAHQAAVRDHARAGRDAVTDLKNRQFAAI